MTKKKGGKIPALVAASRLYLAAATVLGKYRWFFVDSPKEPIYGRGDTGALVTLPGAPSYFSLMSDARSAMDKHGLTTVPGSTMATKKIAPRLINAPAQIASAKSVIASALAFLTPAVSTRWAISSGE